MRIVCVTDQDMADEEAADVIPTLVPCTGPVSIQMLKVTQSVYVRIVSAVVVGPLYSSHSHWSSAYRVYIKYT